jgi:hypothetical protein
MERKKRKGFNIEKRFVGLILILSLFQCASVDVSSLPETEKDKEEVAEKPDLSKVSSKKIGVAVFSKASPELEREFGLGLKKATESLVNSLGGVQVVTDHGSWESQIREQELLHKKEMQAIKLAMMKGEDEKIKFRKRETKYISWSEVHANLLSARSYTEYVPAKEIKVKDKDGNERLEMSDPYWSTTVNVHVFFKVIQTNPGQPRSVALMRNVINSFGKSTPNKPKEREIVALYPEAILYCYEDIKEELQELFPVRTYLTAMKDEKGYGKIVGGSNLGLVTDRSFEIYQREMMPTVLGEREILHKVGRITLIDVKEGESWGKLSGPYFLGLGSKENIKLGMDAIIVPERRTIFHKLWRIAKSYIGITGVNFLGEEK